ncbi:hypothetical protein EHQ53_17750 [Leptospira langatensis]|uniref:Calcineurin-like phosphoesterase domain-containing protein n=1 Tax=Leptospira langatensis TaxID=2484983 RepID=A0A5F1ZRE6_9LEPT|nr:metallophosphoesterase [Leptospira langatensis]TGK05474.1 hypothetical protein EHO57_01990 [Leptospira langatensis]TGL38610.1 hypothetical protein EHQ53_17750 [Leptospira langatensis]
MAEKEDLKIALVGDIHGFWNSSDTRYFSESDYDALIFTGDLGRIPARSSLPVARRISKVQKLGFLIPGNNDGPSILARLFEMFGGSSYENRVSLFLLERRMRFLEKYLAPIRTLGYSIQEEIPGVSLLGARPLAMGSGLSFFPYIQKRFGISTLQGSERLLLSLSEKIDLGVRDLIVVAHNGPSGLGVRAKDIWGCDFRKEAGDFGDEDLGNFVSVSSSLNRKPKVVIAGHMHHSSRSGKIHSRIWKVRKDGILFVNAARVPRIFQDQNGNTWHHHVELTRKNGNWEAEARFLRNGMEGIFPLPDFLEREKRNILEI